MFLFLLFYFYYLMRIHIFGGPGAGKTTLARSLSEKLGVSYYELDNLRFKEEDFDYTLFENDVVRDLKLKKILGRKNWITEGSYTEFAWSCFEKADVIIFFEPIFFKSTWRIFKRFLLYKLGVERRRKRETWRSIPRLIIWNYEFTYRRLPLLKEKLGVLNRKIICVGGVVNVFVLLEKINAKFKK